MAKYIVVEHHDILELVEVTRASYSPAGWHKPYNYMSLDLKTHTRPPQHRKALVHIPGLTTYANNARIVDDASAEAIDSIDDFIKQLRAKRKQIIQDNFRTFRLINESDLQRSRITEVFATKTEAKNSHTEKQTMPTVEGV